MVPHAGLLQAPCFDPSVAVGAVQVEGLKCPQVTSTALQHGITVKT